MGGLIIIMIKITGNRLEIQTKTLLAIMENGFIVSIKSKQTGEEFIDGADSNNGSALELIYKRNEAISVSAGEMCKITVFKLNDYMVELRFNNWNADGILMVSEDIETGDLMIEPSAFSSRPGVRSCRYNIKGFRKDLRCIAPLNQGCDMDFEDSLIAGRRSAWPYSWEAGLCMAQGKDSGLWIHTEDTQYKFKTMTVGACGDKHGYAFESDNYGPIEDLMSAGGLVWRINVYKGDWHVPATLYRDWLWKAFNLEKEEQYRPEWLKDLSLAISWCPTDIKMLEALSKKVDPKRVLLHLPNWRIYNYDEDYPIFKPSDKAREFVAKCKELGYHVMPHCTSMEIDPSLDIFNIFNDFSIRELESGRREGWSWVSGNAGLGVPGSDLALTTHKANKVMIKIHTAFPMWQSILRENIGYAADELNLENIFIDVTLCTYNARMGLVNNMPTTQGLIKELKLLQTIGNGKPLYVGGEGLNEISVQGLCFAQAHLMNRDNGDTQLRTGKNDLNAFLFGHLTRTIGYSDLHGRNENSEKSMQSHIEHGAIPTITIGGTNDIENPTPAVKRILETAAE